MDNITVLLVAGVVLLYAGAEFLVRGSSNLALRLGVSALTVGLTIVAFGTSMPELVVSVKSGFDGLGDIALGNVIGSNIFNVAVILGVCGLVRPISVNSRIMKVDLPVMLAVSLVLLLFLADKNINRIEAAILLTGIIVYTVMTIRSGKKSIAQQPCETDSGTVQHPKGSVLIDVVMIIGGLVALVIGSRAFVKGAVGVAHLLNVSEAFIGLTIVAAGTSLPELATSVVASIKKEGDIAVGNIVGSNIFNILAILGVSGLLTPLESKGIGMVDLAFMMVTAVALVPLIGKKLRLDRIGGGLFMAIYGAYMFYLWPK